MKDYRELNEQAYIMKNNAKDEVRNVLNVKHSSSCKNNLMRVTKRKLDVKKTFNVILDLIFIGMIIYAIIMIPYIFFNGYPY